MNIAIDIDGVLTDVEKFQKEEGTKYFGHPPVNNSYSIHDMFSVSKTDAMNFWFCTYQKYLEEYPFRPYASEIIKKLHENGNKIFIITARGIDDLGLPKEQIKEITLKVLKENDIYFDEYISAASPKVNEAKEYNIDVFIEDSPKNINNLKSVTKVIAFNACYNDEISDVARAYDWRDVYNIIENISIEKHGK